MEAAFKELFAAEGMPVTKDLRSGPIRVHLRSAIRTEGSVIEAQWHAASDHISLRARSGDVP